MLKVGLTGNIASGKSTLLKLLSKDENIITIDADKIVSELYRAGEVGTLEVAKLFGKEYLKDDGSVDKTKLLHLFLNNPAKLRELEKVVHPLVWERIESILSRVDKPIAVIEAVALSGEDKKRGIIDLLVYVDIPEEIAVERASARGLDKEIAASILKLQPSRDKRFRGADFVVYNGGSLDDLERQTDELKKFLYSKANL